MRRLVVLVGIALLALPACGGGTNASGGATRTILTDFNHDEFGTSIFGYFPRVAQVHPGDTIVFKQAWTGEAHTVTFGTLAKPLGDFMHPYLTGEKQPPEGEPPELQQLSQPLPFFFGEKDANQTAAQPCYLASGALPTDEKPCRQVPQPAFTGREVFYSSGFIPYEGNNGNKYSLKLAADIAPGDYYYSCLLHGAAMGGYLRVKPVTTKIPGQSQLSTAARRELNVTLRQLTSADKDARAGKWDLPPGTPHVDVLAGKSTPESALTFGLTNEFYPKRFTAKVGQKVTWMIFGHTVSFRVPKYGPQLRVDAQTHAVRLNAEAYNAVGITIPESEPGDQATVVDAGTYDGSKFLSSGPQFNVLFSVTFTKAGTYQYACTIHPRMVGTLVVAG